MSRYIDIEPILEWCDNPEVFEPYGVNSVELERKIRQAPSIDIVFCKECKYFIDNLTEDATDEMYDACRWDWKRRIPTADDFCSYGSRSEKPNNSTCSKMEQVDEPKTDCNGCKFVGTYDTEFPCANCSRKTKDYYAKDEPQTDCHWK